MYLYIYIYIYIYIHVPISPSLRVGCWGYPQRWCRPMNWSLDPLAAGHQQSGAKLPVFLDIFEKCWDFSDILIVFFTEWCYFMQICWYSDAVFRTWVLEPWERWNAWGFGSYAEVLLARHKKTRMLRALKRKCKVDHGGFGDVVEHATGDRDCSL